MQHDKVDKSTSLVVPFRLYFGNKQERKSRAIVTRDDGFEWQAQGPANLISPPLSLSFTLCVCLQCVGCVKKKRRNWEKLSQLCLSSDRWLMNCERSLSVSIQTSRIKYSATATWCGWTSVCFFFFPFFVWTYGIKKGRGLVMQPNNLPSIDNNSEKKGTE